MARAPRSPAAGGVTAGEFVVVGADHLSSPIGARERLARDGEVARFLGLAREFTGLGEAFPIVTCNRIECWGTTPRALAERASTGISSAVGIPGLDVRVATGGSAFLHAVRVASGLASGVWGEKEVHWQVREAARAALGSAPDSPLSSVVRGVLKASVAVRRSAGLQASARGAPEAAIDLVRRMSPNRGSPLLVLGAGAVGRRAAAYAARFGPVTLAARDPKRAQPAATLAGAELMDLRDALRALPAFAALVVALRSDDRVVREGHLHGRRAADGIVIVDLSFPRAVEPAVRSLPGVTVADLDDLARQEGTCEEGPRASAAEAEARAWATRLQAKHAARAAEGIIADLRRRAESIRREEVEAARRRLRGEPSADAAVLDKLAGRMVNRLLHEPTLAIRWAASQAAGAPGDGLARPPCRGRREDRP